jgi:CRISPR-associated protein Csx3
MNPFPAVAIGGPPHSGKSVLTYLLTQQLRAWKVEHYVLRACPDGEGDWSQEAPPETVRLLRQKGQFSDAFVDLVCRDLARRHLPLLVDVGGKPTPEQERIFDQCTHAVLIASDIEKLKPWRQLAERHGLVVVAELHSVLDGTDAIEAETPVLRGRIGKLERHAGVGGPMTTALAKRLQQIFSYTDKELKGLHFPHAPTELIVDIDQLGNCLGLPAEERRWQPQHLPEALRCTPKDAISIYGRGPNWLYTALALHAAPHPVYLFDPRLGWTQPAALTCVASAEPGLITWQLETQADFTWLTIQPGASYLDYEEVSGATLPLLDPGRGVVLSGKLPYWLLVGAALAYRHHPWIAVVQAQQERCGIVVMGSSPLHRPGTCLAFGMVSSQNNTD